MRWHKSVMKASLLFAASLALTLISPQIVGFLDYKFVHGGRYMQDRMFYVQDPAGKTIGHGSTFWSATTINMGKMQDASISTNDNIVRVQYWTSQTHPTSFTALS